MNLCPWESAQYFVYSSNIPTLFFYSHIPAMFVAILLGLLVYYKSDKLKLSKILLFISTSFFMWCFFDLILWATNRPDVVMFFWSMQILIEPVIFASSFYLVYFFIKNKDISFYSLINILLLLSPFVFLLATNFNLVGVDVFDCNAIEGVVAQYYTYFVESIFIIAIFLISILEYKKTQDKVRKKEIKTFSIGVVLFLIAFSWGNIIGSFTDNWSLAQAGLIGMPILVGFLSYLIVKFKTFHVKLLGAQVLVGALWFLVLGILFVRTIENVKIITSFTLALVTVAGYSLIKSVQREVKQKEQLQKVSEDLFDANEKLKGVDKLKTEFLSLASHQLRSPLTAINGYTSMLLDGDFGTLDEKQKETVDKVFESSKHLTRVVEDLLSVTKIEQGGMQFVMAPFDFEKTISDIVSDMIIVATKKNLKLSFETDENIPYTVNGDLEKIRQVIINLLDNSIKYTKEGSISLMLTKDVDKKKVILAIKDTGMGMTKETLDTLFQKFARGQGGKVNTGGSGLGLYLAKKIVEAHKGNVWVESPGEGQGSTFFVELDFS